MSPALLAVLAGSAMGGPEGERVVAGQAAFDRVGSATTITAGNNAIIEYGSFDIGANESVRFVQPSADARVLNRVLGVSPTRIDGALSANGRVYIVNEAGVFFGQDAVVNAGAIYAAAGTMTNRDFLGGVDRFGGLDGEVRNEGAIAAAEIHLAGRRVTNLGSLSAGDGFVTMTAGDEVLIGPRDGHVFVRASSPSASDAAAGGVEQSGSIDAGRVRIGSGDLFSVALGASSRIRGAEEVRIESEGRGTVHVRGGIDASSSDGVGGRVAITGEGVAVVGAKVDASGALGGGEVLVGGGYRGDSSVIDTASRVYVSPDTELRADATTAGDGGTVVAWADDAMVFEGSMSIRGGAIAGDGGRAEVSSPRFVSFLGRVDASAPTGKRGSLLIDPDNITITDTPAAVGDTLLDDNQIPVAEAPGLDVVVSVDTLESIGDVSVLLEAAEEIRLTSIPDGLLDFEATSGQTITFNAGEAFVVDDGISITTQGGGLTIFGGDTVSLAGIDARGGTVDVTAGMSIDAPARIVSDGGTISYTVTGGSRTVSIGNTEAATLLFDVDTIDLTGNLIAQGVLDLTGVSTIAVNDASTGATLGAISGADTFGITLDPAVTLSGAGGLRFVGSTVTLPAVSGLSELEVTATDTLTLAGDIALDNRSDGLGGRIDLREASSVVLLGDTMLSTTADGSIVAGDVLLNGASVTGGGAVLTIDAGGDSAAERGVVSLGMIDVDDLELTGGTAELRGDLAVASTLSFAGVDSVRIEEDSTISTGGATLTFAGRAIDGPASLGIDLTGPAGFGALGFGADIGSVEALSSLSITGGTIALPSVRTTGGQTYTADRFVNLTQDIESTSGGSIVFNGRAVFNGDRTITTAGAAADNIEFLGGVTGFDAGLTTDTGLGAVVFAGEVTGSTLTTLGSTELRGAALSLEETVRLGDDVARDRVTLASGTSLVRSRTADVVFRSDIQGGGALAAAVDPTATGNNTPVIWFEGDVGTETAIGSLELGAPDAAFFGGVRSAAPEVATVVAARFDADGNPIGDLSFTFETTGGFTMNPLEKMTALGDLTVRSGGTARIGDMNTPGTLRIESPDILINTRAPGDLVTINDEIDPPALRPAFATSDFGVDFVVGGSAIFDGPVRLSDASLPQPSIAEPAGQARIVNVLTRAPQTAVEVSDLAFNRRTGAGPASDRTTVLDAVAQGAVTVPLAEGLTPESTDRARASATNRGLAMPRVAQASPTEGAGGFSIRGPSDQESVSAARGVALYVDVPTRLGESGGTAVSSARLRPGDAEALGGAWARLASALNESPSDSEAVLSRVRATLGVAAAEYERAAGAVLSDTDSFALFTSIRRSQSDATRGLLLVGDVIAAVRSLRLSEGETARLESAIIEGIRPESLDAAVVRGLVESAVDSR
ncbi:MAG: filamentous hemagglutinin N-terminal domain-containing protein [Planctomycetota bacterium]